MWDTATQARDYAVAKAKEAPDTTWYVHEYAQSVVTFKATSVVSVETEMINDDPFAE